MPSPAYAIKDIQSDSDTRAVAINCVGVSRVRLPMHYRDGGATCPTIGEWSADTSLAADVRGTHMSRLMRLLNDAANEIDYEAFTALPAQLLQSLPADECRIAVRFSYFVPKAAPISGEKGYLDVNVLMTAHCSREQGQRQLMQVVTPVTSLCPCSKAISEYGAHNQRSHITLSLEAEGGLRVCDLIALAENGASCELYPVLKRCDERHVTERAYDNPKFVEDIVRDLAVLLQRDRNIRNYRIETENFESIHNHSAHAMIESDDFPAYLLK